MFEGIAGYREDAGFAKAIKPLLAPVAEQLRQHNLPPEKFVGNLVNAHLFFSATQVPVEQKQAALLKLAKDYGVELPSAAQPDDDGEYVDPQVKGLRDHIGKLESQINELTTGQRSAAAKEAENIRATAAKEIETFAADPANPYFYDVADEIAALIRGSGGQMSVKDAYDKACWANPVVRAKLVAEQTAAATKKAEEERARKVAEAEAARGGRVRTSGHQGSGTAATGSMDDTMMETLSAIRKRDR